ncbi:MAG: hypothetical protein ACE5Q6_20220 [Dehalococcoidia bacterium]
MSLGTLLPAAGNVFLELAKFIPLNDKWTHSPLTLTILALMGLVAHRLKLTGYNLYLLAVLGVAFHLAADFLFDFPLLFFNASTDDIGGWWLYPFTRVTLYGPRLEPGIEILPWYLIIEGIFLAGAVYYWRRWELAGYGAVAMIVTLAFFGYIPGVA